ncbi:MAG: Exodeoxyribonuclease 7 small subunit [Alphaproteobacteria bacterium ADurb.Bin438]|nr:MAG: Exodeoxyribonuclease 7 small subunit [Alphaproteobacteria bacterium ADurb.Bin438]
MSEEKSFEATITELEKIIKELESGQVPLEKAVEYYEKGVKLKQTCENILNNARMKISKVETLENGELKITE